MYIKNREAFTFVELIVVITILAILATIGFGVYQTYLAGGRDTNRLIQLNDIHDGLELYSINSRLPFPEDMFEIQASGNTFAYQGYAGSSVIQAIGYDGGGQDTEHGTYLTYMLGDNGRDFQLMTHISDTSLLSNIGDSSYANVSHYQGLFPKVTGGALGIMVEDISNIPLQEIEAVSIPGNYDILSGTVSHKSYFSDTDILYSDEDDITELIPNKSCKRIKELGKDIGSGIYVINPSGTGSFRVYCDMEADGGGWTYVGFIHENANGENLYFDRAFGGYEISRSASGSSYMLDASALNHSESLFLYEGNDILNANNTDNLLHFRYSEGIPGMYGGNIMSADGNDFFGGFGGIEYRGRLSDEWNFTNTVYNGGWGVTSFDGNQLVIRIRGGTNTGGVYKYTGVWGANPNVGTQRNEAWIYVR